MSQRVGSAYVTERDDGRYGVHVTNPAGTLSVVAPDYEYALQVKTLLDAAVEAGRAVGYNDARVDMRRILGLHP